MPRIPESNKQKKPQMSRTEIANTMMWAHKEDIEQARLPKITDVKLQTSSMNIKERSDIFH